MVAVTCALTLLALMLAWCAWRVFRSCPSFIDHPVVFFLPVCGALLVLRLPQIKWNCELNPDESQKLAQGMRFLSHPVSWRDVANQGERTLRLLDKLDEIVLGNGGILYPAKDARMSPRSFETSYPNWKEFAKFIDPTPMTSHLRKGALFAPPERVARDISRAIEHGKSVLYTPAIWFRIRAVIRLIPETLFKRLKL